MENKHVGAHTPQADPSPAKAITVEYGSLTTTVAVESTSTDLYIPSARLPVRVYDPHFYNTAACISSISRVDREAGKLYLRGYDMETLVSKSDFLQVAYLLIYGGRFPTPNQTARWKQLVLSHTYLHEDIRDQLRTFRYDAHPMGMLISTFSALSTFHPEANPALQGVDLYVKSEATVNKQIFRILGKVITTAACAYRVRLGRPFNVPEPADSATYTENFLSMLDRLSEPSYKCHPELARLLDVLFIALIDDGMNSATGVLRHVASSKVDPYTAISAAFAAAYGTRISGVGDAVLAMLTDIGTPSSVPSYVAAAKSSRTRLQGFGHLNYKAYDPRCRVVKQIALQVAELMGPDPLLAVAQALEDYVLCDPYFTTRSVYPNVDLYLSLTFRMMGFPSDYFCVLVCIPRTAGWLAHWRECLHDKSARIARPRQIYTGSQSRDYIDIDDRPDPGTGERQPELNILVSGLSARRDISRAYMTSAVNEKRCFIDESE